LTEGFVSDAASNCGGEADLYSLKVPHTARFVFSSGVIGKAES
jgi:hypothetical protein